jgi:signal transduction histidine kinase
VRRATTLLDISRLNSGQTCIDRERVDLAEVVEEVLAEMAFDAERAGCDLSASIEKDVVGWWDQAALEQIALNLLSNAIKYGAGRPVEVSVRSEGARPHLRAVRASREPS